MTTPPLPAETKPSSSKLAKASLICGIAGFLTGPVGGIPAIITGHLALNRIKRSADAIQGKGIAIAGLILGYFTTFVVGAILLAAGFAAVNAAIRMARMVTAHNMAMSFESATNGFFTDQGRLPMEGDTDATIQTDKAVDVLNALLGSPGSSALNPKGIKYLAIRTVTERKGGLMFYPDPDGTSVAMFDPWGNPFHVVFDLDNNELVTVSDGPGAPVTLKGRRVAVWSDGPDRTPGTMDDIKTW